MSLFSIQTKTSRVKGSKIVLFLGILYFIFGVLLATGFFQIRGLLPVFFLLSAVCHLLFAWENTHCAVWKWFLGGSILDWLMGIFLIHFFSNKAQEMPMFFVGLWLSIKSAGIIGYTTVTAGQSSGIKSRFILLVSGGLALVMSLPYFPGSEAVKLNSGAFLLLGICFFTMTFNTRFNSKYGEEEDIV